MDLFSSIHPFEGAGRSSQVKCLIQCDGFVFIRSSLWRRWAVKPGKLPGTLCLWVVQCCQLKMLWCWF